MDDVAFSFVMLYNSMVGREKAMSFGFTSLSELLASAPCHAVKNDACLVLCRLAILVDGSSCVPGVIDQLASSFIALGIETLGIGGVLCTGFESSGLEEIEKVAFFRAWHANTCTVPCWVSVWLRRCGMWSTLFLFWRRGM